MTRTFARLFMLLLSLWAGGGALADSKTLAGNSCLTNATHFIYSGPKVCNTSTTSSLTVYCPVVRDDYSASLDWFYSYVVDPTPNSSVSCTVYVLKYATGSSFKAVSKSTSSSGYSSSAQKLSFGAISTSGTDITYLKCTLPTVYNSSQSCVVSYLWSE